MSRTLILIGLAFVVLGLAWPLIQRLGLGHLPGDIVIRREGFQLYFPIVTSLVLSALISFVFWLINR